MQDIPIKLFSFPSFFCYTVFFFMRNYYVYICEINGKPMFLQRAQKGDWVIKKCVLVGRKKICKIIGTVVTNSAGNT